MLRCRNKCLVSARQLPSQRPNHIVTDILLRVQEQFRSMCTSSSLKPQESEITKLACTLGTKSHIVIPQEWLHNTPHQYQAHLERMSDFLLSCPGSWYFTTTTPNVPLPLYCTQWHRTISANEMERMHRKQHVSTCNTCLHLLQIFREPYSSFFPLTRLMLFEAVS